MCRILSKIKNELFQYTEITHFFIMKSSNENADKQNDVQHSICEVR